MSGGIKIEVDKAMYNTITKALNGMWYKTESVIMKASDSTARYIQKMVNAEADKMYLLKGKTSKYKERMKVANKGNLLGSTIKWMQKGGNDLYEAQTEPKSPTPWSDAASWVSAHVKADSSGGKVSKYGHKAFIATMPGSGHTGVFVRKQGDGKRIEQVQTLTYPAAAAQAYEKTQDEYGKIFYEKVEWQMKKVMDEING